MPNVASIEAISHRHPHPDRRCWPRRRRARLPSFLRTTLDADLAALVEADNDTALTESDRAGNSQQRRDALDALEPLARDGCNHIKAIPSYETTIAAPARRSTRRPSCSPSA
jgi:hypothetical protein